MANKRFEEIVDDFDDSDGTDYGDQPGGQEPEDDNDEPDAGDLTSDDGDDGEDSDDDAGDSESSTDDPRGQRVRADGKQEVERRSQLRPAGHGLFQDAQGNLVDQTGKIVARGGTERRLFEKNTRLQGVLQDSMAKYEQLVKGLDDYKHYDNVQREYGITQDDLKVGLPIIGEFRKDPPGAARKLLEIVISQGYSLQDVFGKDGPQGIQTSALTKMLDERLKPLEEVRQSGRTQVQAREAEQAAQAEFNKFVDQNEYSSVHLEAIDNLLGKYPDKSPEWAYNELRVFCAKHGLDFSRPLAPQIEGAQRANGNRGTQQRQPARNGRPMPHGRGGRSRPMEEVESAGAKDEWSDIIRRSMSNNGMRG